MDYNLSGLDDLRLLHPHHLPLHLCGNQFQDGRSIDAISSHHCVCSMAWRFHATDATFSP